MMTHRLSSLVKIAGIALFAWISVSGAADAAEPKSFWDRFHPSADGRLRYEYDGDRFGGADDRHRGRARFRFGGTADITDELTGGLRIRTGNSNNANSPHENFGGFFGSWEIALDRAYLRWAPGWATGAWAEGGKVPNRFKTNPVYGELVWDADVNPEGGQFGFRYSSGGLTLGGTTGIWVLNLEGSETATVFPIQGHGEYKFSDELSLTGALGYYGYQNLANGGAAVGASFSQNSNATTLAGVFISDFDILDAVVSVTYTGLPVSLTLAGEIIHNSGARTGEDTGWAAGLSAIIPLAERKHRFFYQYQRVEQDAVFSPMAQDDFQSLPSNFKGHILGVDWAVTKGVKIRTWGLFQKRILGGDGTTNTRIRADINVKF